MRDIVRDKSDREMQAIAGRNRRAFTLLDVLVSLSVIVVLIGLMLPALNGIRETGRQVVCSSNIRQIGIGMAMYADDHRRHVPYSRFYIKSLNDPGFEPQSLMMAKVAPPGAPPIGYRPWDGVGILFDRSYCNAGPVYYCPSHKADHVYRNNQAGWNGALANVYTNFQYRGGSATGKTNMDMMAERISLLADGMASDFDFNHSVGGNIVASDLSVSWFDDSARRLPLPYAYNDPQSKDKLLQAWSLIDEQLYK